METVDSAQKSQGEVTKQMCAKLYNYKRIFMLQMALSALSFCTMFLDLGASLRGFNRAGGSAFVMAVEYHHTLNNLGAASAASGCLLQKISQEKQFIGNLWGVTYFVKRTAFAQAWPLSVPVLVCLSGGHSSQTMKSQSRGTKQGQQKNARVSTLE